MHRLDAAAYQQLTTYVIFKGVHNKLQVFRRHWFYTLLNDVISVLVLHTLYYTSIQFPDDGNLHVQWDGFHRFLNNATSVHLQR